jgi:hypothetical protein
MSTVHKILKNALKNMNYVGSGCYAAAFDSNKEIVKIGADIFDPYLYYLREIKSLKNTHFPKFHSLYVDNYNEFYTVKLEKLYPLNDKQLKDYEQLYDWAVKGEDKPCWASEELEEAVNKIVDLADVISLQPSEDLEYEGQTGDCRLDLHEANVMSRSDGTLVFTDPLSDAQMFDAPAIEEWIDDYLYYTNKK